MNAFYWVAEQVFILARGYLLAWVIIYLVNFIFRPRKKEE
jgi:hypothetical protein